MIANIHDDVEPSLHSPPRRSAFFHDDRVKSFSNIHADDDAMFRRLGRNIIPERIWIRDVRGSYEVSENPSLLIEGYTLCQIGVHLVPSASQRGGRFCQIVSGSHRGLRFEFKAEDFFHALDGEE